MINFISLTLYIKVTFNCLCTNHWYRWFRAQTRVDQWIISAYSSCTLTIGQLNVTFIESVRPMCLNGEVQCNHIEKSMATRSHYHPTKEDPSSSQPTLCLPLTFDPTYRRRGRLPAFNHVPAGHMCICFSQPWHALLCERVVWDWDRSNDYWLRWDCQ